MKKHLKRLFISITTFFLICSTVSAKSFNYDVTVKGNNIEGFEATCTFTIDTDGTNITGISWKDAYSKAEGKLNENQISFQCAGKTVNFWNTNLLGKILQQKTNDVAIADFKNTWIQIYKDINSQPKVEFANQDGQYYAYFPDYEKDKPIYNTGGTTEDDKNNNNSNNNNTNNTNTDSPTNKNAEEIKNAFLGNTTCGGLDNFTFPNALPAITSFLYTLLKIAIPVILVIKGSMDLFKAAASQKEDEMKKAQKKFTQRLIAGVIALLAFIIVETVINFIAKRTGDNNAIKCVNCFIKNQCQTVSTTNTSNNNNNSNGDRGTTGGHGGTF